jgi:hypothetical protein
MLSYTVWLGVLLRVSATEEFRESESAPPPWPYSPPNDPYWSYPPGQPNSYQGQPQYEWPTYAPYEPYRGPLPGERPLNGASWPQLNNQGGSGQGKEQNSREWKIGSTVITSSGRVTGHPAGRRPQVSEYLGIPFAKVGQTQICANLAKSE